MISILNRVSVQVITKIDGVPVVGLHFDEVQKILDTQIHGLNMGVSGQNDAGAAPTKGATTPQLACL